MSHDVAVVGVAHAERRLVDAGLTDVAVLHDCDLRASTFDEATHCWALPTCRARIVVTDQMRSGRDGLAPYLGVAVHGVPNYFTVTGTNPLADARLGYITACLEQMRRTDTNRIEVLFSTQRTFVMLGAGKADRADPPYWRRMAELIPTAFDMRSDSGPVDEVYDGTAMIRACDGERPVRVRLSGRLDPIDGRYHWQGTAFDGAADAVPMQPGPVTLMIGERSAACRITERMTRGRYSVAGVGAPPYALDDVEVVVPIR
jgi:Domain of unknown function (DUF4873)